MKHNNSEKTIDNIKQKLKPFQLKFNNGFWAEKLMLVRSEVIPYQWKALNDQIPDAEPSHAIENFRIAAGEVKSEFAGRIFQDSDVAKWLEAASYSLAYSRDPELEKITDELIDLIEKAQQADGYLNTFFTVERPNERWTNLRDCHEMYCAGHMIEAAVAYYKATGKRKLLNVACRLADHIDSKFGPEEGKLRGYPGHPEIELALVKLYRVTGESKYLNLSKFFINERGKEPHYFDLEAKKRGKDREENYGNIFDYKHRQSHLPVREQSVAVGHAVRAMYFYSGVTDIVIETGDEELKNVVKRLWENVTRRQMYITGGVGAESHGEAFSFDYDLPNDRAYTETCAAIGLVFWAQRMLHLELDGKYADIMEKALYNGVLSGISLDGQKYFYVNPLEVWPEACENRYDLKHVESERQQWFGCACCPPNIARLIASIGRYVYSNRENEVYLHLYADSTAKFWLSDQEIKITQKTNYPWDKDVKIIVSTDKPARFTLGLRLPGWCRKPYISINGNVLNLEEVSKRGYALIEREWKEGDVVHMVLPMPVEKIAANPKVKENSGKIAILRGPVVYCLEEVDNGPNLQDIVLPLDSELNAEFAEDLLGGIEIVKGEALRTVKDSWGGELYKVAKPDMKKVNIKAVPYFAWANRNPGEMLVWIRQC